MIVVPGLFAAILGWIFEYETAEDLFPFVLVTLVVPLGLVIAPKTRRFGMYMLIGLVDHRAGGPRGRRPRALVHGHVPELRVRVRGPAAPDGMIGV